MGLYDRDYVRDETPPGVQLRAPKSMVVTLMIINGVVYVANYLFFSQSGPYQNGLMYNLAVSLDSLYYPWRWWQLLTAGFAHNPGDIWHIAMNMFVLYVFGNRVEERLGRWEFLRFFLIAIVVGSLAFCVRILLTEGADSQALALGASGATTAVTILFALQNPKATIYFMMLFPMPAWMLAILVVVLNVLGTQGVHRPDGESIAYDVHLAGAAMALAYHCWGWNFGRIVPSSLSDGWRRVGKFVKRKPNLRVLSPEEEWKKDDKYAHDEDEADKILVKIKRDGINSLTPRERKIMDDYSRRMKQKHR